MADYDLTMRVLAREYPKDMAFLTLGMDIEKVELRDTDLGAIERRADWLAQVVVGKEEGLIQTEFQTQYDPDKLGVMHEYRIRARNSYGLPVFSCIVYLTEEGYPGPGHNRLEERPFGHYQGFFEPHEVRLWEFDADEILATGHVGLIPLASLMKGEGDEPLRKAVGAASEIAHQVQRADAMTAIAVLGSLRHPADVIRRLIRRELMKESVIYQEILEEGREEGLRDLILRALRRRFQMVDEHIPSGLECVRSFERLEDLAEQAIVCESLEAFERLLTSRETDAQMGAPGRSN